MGTIGSGRPCGYSEAASISLDLLPGVDLVANRLEARGQLGDGEGDGGTAGQVETQLLELVLRHFLADAKALTDAHGLGDRLLALPHDRELALEETAVLDPACVLDEPSGLVCGTAQRGTLGVTGLLLEIGLTRGQIRREGDDAVDFGQQGRDVRSSPLGDEDAYSSGLLGDRATARRPCRPAMRVAVVRAGQSVDHDGRCESAGGRRRRLSNVGAARTVWTARMAPQIPSQKGNPPWVKYMMAETMTNAPK